jgi:hypothetical protein
VNEISKQWLLSRLEQMGGWAERELQGKRRKGYQAAVFPPLKQGDSIVVQNQRPGASFTPADEPLSAPTPEDARLDRDRLFLSIKQVVWNRLPGTGAAEVEDLAVEIRNLVGGTDVYSKPDAEAARQRQYAIHEEIRRVAKDTLLTAVQRGYLTPGSRNLLAEEVADNLMELFDHNWPDAPESAPNWIVINGQISEAIRDWIHEQPWSLCDAGADTCPDWDKAYEIRDVVFTKLARWFPPAGRHVKS